MKIKRNQTGFTLIEVVLVLAIGGLIFLLAFLAFSQVSTNRRDTQRRSDAGRALSELQNFKSDNNQYPLDVTTGGASGATTLAPASVLSFFNTYMGGANFKAPGGSAYTIVASTNTAPAQDNIGIYNNRTCAVGTTGLASGTQTGKVAVIIGLEKGSVCRDDS
jgi:prepilin-type N-terminal cleavage/methylation domain-containing protein